MLPVRSTSINNSCKTPSAFLAVSAALCPNCRQTQTEHDEATAETVNVSLLDIFHHVPTLPEILTPDSQKALSATCKSCRLRFVAQVQFVTLVHTENHACVFEQWWLSLRMPFMAAKLADLQLLNLRALDLMNSYLTEAAVFELARADWPNLTNLSIGYADLDVMSVDRDMLQSWMIVKILSIITGKKAPVYHNRGMASLRGHGVGLWPNLQWIRVFRCIFFSYMSSMFWLVLQCHISCLLAVSCNPACSIC